MSSEPNAAYKEYFSRNLKKVIAKLGDVAVLDEIAEANLSDTLAQKINGKADSATTLNGYGIEDAYTKDETDAKIAAEIDSVYTPAGDKTVAELTSSLLVAANLGNVYNITTAGTTTADFKAGAGKTIPLGADVAVVNVGTAESPVYKFNVLSGFVDLTDYATKSYVDTEVAKKAAKTDFEAETTGIGNVVTAVSYDSATGKTTATKGVTAILTTDLVDLTDAEVDALFVTT